MEQESMKDFEQEIEESLKKEKKIETEDMAKWEELKVMMEEGKEADVKVIEVVKAGCVAYLNDVRGFIPASQLSNKYVENLDDYQSKHIKVRVITVDPEKKKLVLSHKVIEQEEEKRARDEKLASIKVGDVLDGKVESLKDFGAFVDLGGISSLLHISQISRKRVKTPKDVLSVGQEVKVKVIKIEDGKIGISMRELEPEVGEFAKEPSDSEAFKYVEKGTATTNLGSLLKNIKLN